MAVVVALSVSATTLSSVAAQDEASVGVDADPAGNAATSLGDLQHCRRVEVNDAVDVDVYAVDLPGLEGLQFILNYDPAIVQITKVDDQQMIAANGGSQATSFSDNPNIDMQSDADNKPEGSDGSITIAAADFSEVPDESGSGVLARVTLKALAPGVSDVTLSRVKLLRSDPDNPGGRAVPVEPSGYGQYFVGQSANANISVGQDCSPPPPVTLEAPPAPSPAPEPEGSPGTGGQTPAATISGSTEDGASLAVDADPTGNASGSLGAIDRCIPVASGSTFDIDVAVRDVNALLAFQVYLGTDPSIVHITNHDTNLFLGITAGSNVSDASERTPDSDGVYSVGAADTADPLSPESGTGVLTRITLQAVAPGISPLSLLVRDFDGDGKLDQAPLLRNVDAKSIADRNGDSFFDGPLANAAVAVDASCTDVPAAFFATSTPIATSRDGADGEDGGNGDTLAIVVGVVVIAAVVIGAAAGAFVWQRRRRA